MIKMLLLVGALGAGAALLHAQYTNPGPITLSDLAHSTDQGMAVAKDANDKAGDVADTVSGAAQTGVKAAKSTAGFVSDTYDAGARMVGDLKSSMTAAQGHSAKPAATLVEQKPNPGAGAGVVHSRAGALDTLPEDQVLPPSPAAE